MFGLPQSAYATCISSIQSQTVAAAYNGDENPTVHTMDTCSGDDISYQIPIATTITFDGIEYSEIYATTNSVITFGRPDGTYWDYPTTPSISLYSMDWYPGASGTDGLDIYYSEGGFQINLDMVPYGNYSAEPSTVNILVAITNTGGISVAYSYQGPEYANMRTGVRLHDGSIVSLEAWGATQIEPGDEIPTLEPEPVVDPTASPEPTPLTPEQEQAISVEASQLAGEIADLNNLIASINGEPEPEVTTDPEPNPEPTPEPTEDAQPEPDVVVEPEIITPEDPIFPDEEVPSDEDTTEPDIIDEPTDEPIDEPVKEDNPKEDITPISEDKDDKYDGLSDKELAALNEVISKNDLDTLLALSQTNESVKQAVEEFTERLQNNENAPMPYTIADAITEVQAEKFLDNPVAVLTDIDLEVLTSPSEWGKDMTDDQREKVQEVVIPVILASNIIAASMTRRIK